MRESVCSPNAFRGIIPEHLTDQVQKRLCRRIPWIDNVLYEVALKTDRVDNGKKTHSKRLHFLYKLAGLAINHWIRVIELSIYKETLCRATRFTDHSRWKLSKDHLHHRKMLETVVSSVRIRIHGLLQLKAYFSCV
jgi:hypothetical protein